MLFFLLSLISCSTSENENLQTIPEVSALKNERVYFKNLDEFDSKYTELSKTNVDQNSDDNSNLSPAMNQILNKNNEFQISKEIIWYNEGIFYSINIKNEKKIDKLKQDYKNLPKTNIITVNSIKISNSEKRDISNNRTVLNTGGGIDARYQLEFRRISYTDCGSTINQGPSNAKIKYVHEVYSETIRNGYTDTHYLYLRIKMEWYNGSRWKMAGEKRTINVNISDNSQLIGLGGHLVPNNFAPYGINYINSSYSCSGDKTILLRSNSVSAGIVSQWSAEVSGTIYQKINGDSYQNEWNNYVNW